MPSLAEFLSSFAKTIEVLRGQRQWRIEQQWNEAFAKGTKDATGRWVVDGMRWQNFSSGFDVALAGARAEQAYASRVATQYFAFSSEVEFHLVMCADAALPPVDAILRYVYSNKDQYALIKDA